MPHLTVTLVLTALSAFSLARVDAQQIVYRCGNAYGPQPCPNGRAIDVSDSRSSAQKAHAQKIRVQTEKSAQALNQTHLKQEKSAKFQAFDEDFSGAQEAPDPTAAPDAKKAASAFFTAKSMPSASGKTTPPAVPHHKTAAKK